MENHVNVIKITTKYLDKSSLYLLSNEQAKALVVDDLFSCYTDMIGPLLLLAIAIILTLILVLIDLAKQYIAP